MPGSSRVSSTRVSSTVAVMANEAQSVTKSIEENMEKARGAVTGYLENLQKMIGVNPWAGNELFSEAQRFSSDNIHATFEFLNRLSKAKDIQDAIRIQTEFMQAQMGSFADQFKTISDSFAKAVSESTKAGRSIPIKKE